MQNLQFYIPCIDTIGSVDDLIEKNEEIITILHDFLNKKYSQFTDGKQIIKIGNLNYFQICKSGIKYFEGNKIYLDTASVDNANIVDETNIIAYSKRPSRANMQPFENSVWFAKLKDSPKYILVKTNSKDIISNYIFSTGFMGLQSEPYLVNYLYCLILSKDFNRQKDLLSNGATMQGINNDSFREISVPKISASDATMFGRTIENYVNMIVLLKTKNHSLKQLKTQLLQKYFG
ncbi:MAG: hypothetical protein NC311_11265 [Muribaculaceae bacterium]|nr:hypothetical protein [Muribaculaceae bacterium]